MNGQGSKRIREAPSRSLPKNIGAFPLNDTHHINQPKEDKADLEGLWKLEIANLQGREFLNIEQALNAISSAVSERLGGGRKGTMGEIEFVKDLLRSDPEVINVLRSELKFKS